MLGVACLAALLGAARIPGAVAAKVGPLGPRLIVPQSFPYPTDYRFVLPIHGAGFKPGEHVRLAPPAGSLVTDVVADAAGTFVTPISFTWVFCGRDGRSRPLAGAITASGDEGSEAETTLSYPESCPWLTTAQDADSAPDGSPRHLLGVTLRGFGFRSGERVTVREGGMVPHRLAPLHLTASALGTFRVATSLYVAGRCNFAAKENWVVVTGMEGNALDAPLSPNVPADGCSAPLGPPQPAYNGVFAALHLQRTVVRPGAEETVVAGAGPTVRYRLMVRYPGGRVRHVRLTAADLGTRTATWRIPASARAGVGLVTLALPGMDDPPLRVRFRVVRQARHKACRQLPRAHVPRRRRRTAPAL